MTVGSSPSVADCYDDEETLSILQAFAGAEFALLKKAEDCYSIASCDEEDMARLADSLSADTQPNVPPTSVINDMNSSFALEVFDVTLQRSSPTGSSGATKVCQIDQELLGDEVTWEAILEKKSSLPRLTSPPTILVPAEGAGHCLTPLQRANTILKPFARPLFPVPVRGKSPIVGLSNSSPIKICFRIGELVNEVAKHLKSNQKQEFGDGTVFELYARVTYSSRERTARVQHFQFMDLYREQRPYPTGMLIGWRTASLLDRQSLAFLSKTSGGPQQKQMCRCICSISRDKKSEMGWSLSVKNIREVEVGEIELMRHLICRE
jgi:hypothetical protein